MSATSSTSATSTQEERAEKIDKAHRTHNALEANARRRDVERRQQYKADTSDFASSRVGVITNILRHENDGPCLTDDGERYLEAVMPFMVEMKTKAGQSVHQGVIGWAKTWVPYHLEKIGRAVVMDQINATIAKRERAATEQAKSSKSYIDWLPSMEELVDQLGLTWSVGRALKLRGWGYIDPPTDEVRREHEVALRRESRRRKGAKSQSERNRTKCIEFTAKELSISMSKVKRLIRSEGAGGTMDILVARCGERDPETTVS